MMVTSPHSPNCDCQCCRPDLALRRITLNPVEQTPELSWADLNTALEAMNEGETKEAAKAFLRLALRLKAARAKKGLQ